MADSIIRAYLQNRGYAVPDADWYSQISDYQEWYEGYVKKFHEYRVYNGTSYVGCRRKSLRMAKTICEDHANLLLNERVQINVPEDFTDRLNDILRENEFRVLGNNLVELAFALGTGALVEYLSADQQPMIDYVRAPMIYPISWSQRRITDCAFGSIQRISGKKVYYIAIHRKRYDGTYLIENIYLNDSGKQIKNPDGAKAIVETGSKVPLFQIIRPNIINNYALDNPMGISIYGNALDLLQSVDLIWDSYINEFDLGRKRLMVPLSMAKIQMAQDGTTAPVFDPADTVFYVYQQSENGKNDLKDFNPTIRAEEHEAGLQRALNLLAKKCGLGNDHYRFDGSGIKTATEVISEKSELYQNLQKNEILLRQALIGMTRALAQLSGYNPDLEVNVSFDDSVIEDSSAKKDDHIKLVNAGLESKESAIMDIRKCSRDEAKRELQAIARESQITGTPDDWFAQDGDLNDTGTGKNAGSANR